MSESKYCNWEALKSSLSLDMYYNTCKYTIITIGERKDFKGCCPYCGKKIRIYDYNKISRKRK